MARKGGFLDNFDTSYLVQPPKGSAEPGIEYGGVEDIRDARDPMGVVPEDAIGKNIGPKGGEKGE